MTEQLFSIRMRASRGGEHISGAERIVPAAALATCSAQMTQRALEHPRGVPDAVRIGVDALDPGGIVSGQLPDLTTVRVRDVAAGRTAAVQELVRAGVGEAAARATLQLLAGGANPAGGGLRGAVLVDAESGTRLEPDPARGVRASRMDIAAVAEPELRKVLAAHGLDNEHVREALVLAGKVAMMPGFVAELCWSDDPDYSAGYVCSLQRGYVRYPYLKPLGDPNGGRAFFVRSAGFDREAAMAFLQQTPVLFERIGAIRPDEAYPA
jgi:6-carboxyhexanoate--CoA ligase